MMKSPSHIAMLSARTNQMGAASVAIAMLMMFILVAAVLAIQNMSGSSALDSEKSEEQVAAFFLAESGLEWGQGQLKAASDPALNTACTSMTTPTDVNGIPIGIPLGTRGTFSLVATSAPLGCTAACTSCQITSTGKITGSDSSRTVVRVISLAATSGGATGYGGGCQVKPTRIPDPCPTPPDGNPAHEDIVQYIEVKDVPTVVSGTNPVFLMSSMGYLRHPTGGVTVEAAGCVTIPAGGGCTANWNDQSSSSSGDVVVGSRGVTAKVTAAGPYELRQNLSAHSMYAAVGMKIGGTEVKVIGSFWDDNGPDGTYANSQKLTGETNNGALTNSPAPDTASPPPIINAGTRQTQTSWCYGADTLVLGFSGRSSNNATGSLDSFAFGSAPAVTKTPNSSGGQVPNGFIEYPKSVAGTTNSQVYSSLYYVHNPDYLSNADAISGAVLTDSSAGATFTGTLNGGSNTMVIAAAGDVTVGRLSVGDTISGSSRLGGPGNTSTITGAPAEGLQGTYTLLHNSSGPAATTTGLSATSSVLYVNGVSNTMPGLGNLALGDTIYGTGVTANTTINALGAIPAVACTAGAGGAGCYTLSASQKFGPTTITSNGITVNTSGSITPAATAGTYVTVRWTGSGSGVLPTGTMVGAGPTATSFQLSARPTTPLSGAQVCGGICAFFNHSSASAVTTFTIAIPGTQQWAAGITCFSGVDTSSITGLIGDGSTVKATNWYEPVR